jgi:imidazolonepropionase-like amidohydrolase
MLHVHITWSFGKDGKNAGMGGTTPDDAYRAASNAWVTLMAGFTTVQSVGSPNDIQLHDAIAKGIHPDPRIPTAVAPLEGRGRDHKITEVACYDTVSLKVVDDWTTLEDSLP